MLANGSVVASLMELTRGYQLRRPIAVRSEWSPQMKCFVAYEEEFHWHGVGDSPEDAMADLVEAIVENYLVLQNWPGEMDPGLSSRLKKMKEIIVGMNKYNYKIMWSDEDEGYIATVAEFPLLSAFGETAEDAIREMNVVLEAVDVPDNHQLLPCPFCGGEAWFASDDVTWWAGCEPCGVELTGTTDKIETFARWNRRA